MIVLFLFATMQAPAQTIPYWQQEVHYTIEATLDEDAEQLRGAGTLVYQNNSPHDLNEVFFQLNLNAFRPNSVWATTEERPHLNFQRLDEPDFAFARIQSLTLDDQPLLADFPHSPDSTVVRYALPRPLTAGAAATFSFTWEARPSTLCRRQCRDGRSYDFAQWYPRIAPFDANGWQPHPLYPQGEFYGEFGTYDVTLDLAQDQVVGATGVPLSGDPGWRIAEGSPVSSIDYRRNWYESPREAISPGFFDHVAASNRKRVRFYAENVHHFAWSTSPDYRYEGGTYRDIPIHVLFRPGDDDWVNGVVVNRSVRALEWLEGVFGPYPYPQITNLHRIEGGGTEFPMVVMNGSPSQGLIVHEFAHQYAHGILANNEWKDAWLDEGMASFVTNWFAEEMDGANPWDQTVTQVGELDPRILSAPIATSSEQFANFQAYGFTVYNRAATVFHMLRGHTGVDTFREILRDYYNRKRFQHVTEDDLRESVNRVTGNNFDWFFDQWVHSTATLDYAIDDVERTELDNGQWRTVVTVTRSGDAWSPVTLQVGQHRQILESRARSQTVEIITDERPRTVVVDPDVHLLDTDRSNNSN